MTVNVPDASVLVSSLTDDGTLGRWARHELRGVASAMPHSAVAEASNLLRRLEAHRRISAEDAIAAHRDVVDLPTTLYAFRPFADRIWQLRSNVTAYDAWYVAVAETLDGRLLTFDRRLARAPGLRCEVRLP